MENRWFDLDVSLNRSRKLGDLDFELDLIEKDVERAEAQLDMGKGRSLGMRALKDTHKLLDQPHLSRRQAKRAVALKERILKNVFGLDPKDQAVKKAVG